MALIHKFEFGVSFDSRRDPNGGSDPENPSEPPAAPSYSPEDLEATRKEAWEDGFASGAEQGNQAQERRLVEALERLCQGVEILAADQSRLAEEAERRAAEIALAAVRKLLPALAERDNLREIEAILVGVFAHALEQPRLMVRCAPAMESHIDRLAKDVAARAGFDGRLVILPDLSLAQEDCRIEWAEGGVERNPQRMIERIERTILDGLTAFDRTAPQVANAPRTGDDQHE